MGAIYFKSEAKKMVWKIQDIIESTGELLTSHILFIHAWSGCDTTSATYGQGKTFYLKSLTKSLKNYNTYHQYFQIHKYQQKKLAKPVVVCLLFCMVVKEKSP